MSDFARRWLGAFIAVVMVTAWIVTCGTLIALGLMWGNLWISLAGVLLAVTVLATGLAVAP